MDVDQFLAWASPFLNRLPAPRRRLLAEGIELGRSMPRGDSQHYMESSYNNVDGRSLMKVLHFFRYKRGPFASSFTGEKVVRWNILKDYLLRLNSDQGSRLDLRPAEKALRLPLSSGKNNDFFGLALDFKAETNRFEKLTLYFNPLDNRSFGRLCRVFGEGFTPLGGPRPGRGLAFVGLDLFTSGASHLKLYEKGGARLGKLAKGMLGDLSVLRGRGFFKHRFDGKGRPLGRGAQFGIRACPNDEFHAKAAPAGLRHFFKSIHARIRERRVTFIAFEEKKGLVETYFE
jgi:hypothetical protein